MPPILDRHGRQPPQRSELFGTNSEWLRALNRREEHARPLLSHLSAFSALRSLLSTFRLSALGRSRGSLLSPLSPLSPLRILHSPAAGPSASPAPAHSALTPAHAAPPSAPTV